MFIYYYHHYIYALFWLLMAVNCRSYVSSQQLAYFIIWRHSQLFYALAHPSTKMFSSFVQNSSSGSSSSLFSAEEQQFYYHFKHCLGHRRAAIKKRGEIRTTSVLTTVFGNVPIMNACNNNNNMGLLKASLSIPCVIRASQKLRISGIK